jgi:hypothetical protein
MAAHREAAALADRDRGAPAVRLDGGDRAARLPLAAPMGATPFPRHEKAAPVALGRLACLLLVICGRVSQLCPCGRWTRARALIAPGFALP